MSCGNCIKLLDNFIKDDWFIITIFDNVSNYICSMIWYKIAFCIIIY